MGRGSFGVWCLGDHGVERDYGCRKGLVYGVVGSVFVDDRQVIASFSLWMLRINYDLIEDSIRWIEEVEAQEIAAAKVRIRRHISPLYGANEEDCCPGYGSRDGAIMAFLALCAAILRRDPTDILDRISVRILNTGHCVGVKLAAERHENLTRSVRVLGCEGAQGV